MADPLTAAVEELVSMGIPRTKAEARVRDLYPTEAIQVDKAADRRASVLEKDEQRAIRKMAIAVGFKVYWLSQAKASGQTPGLADLWIAHPARQLAAWWEKHRPRFAPGTRSESMKGLRRCAERPALGFTWNTTRR